MKPILQTRVIVGLSGGVDSSVAALLLQQQGYQVEGLFMQNWIEEGEAVFCPADQDLQDARAVCEKLNIPLHTVCFAQQYWDRVFQYFLAEYAAGRTPNPDILCNKEIKFKAFLDYALSLGADFIATGHYARNIVGARHAVPAVADHDVCSASQQPQQLLLKAKDLNKDQSYFLYTLQQEQLVKSLFPLGELTKPEVRELARAAGFVNHSKKDSTGICFIGERRFRDFLGEYLLARPGDIETTSGKKIGRHNGLMFYTLGQRQGLGIGGQKDGDHSPWYVIDKDLTRQVLIVAQAHDHPRLLSKTLTCQQLHWVAGQGPTTPAQISAKTRYRQTDAACTIHRITDDEYQAVFDEPQWAVTPGQSVVFYQGDICLGGGVITSRITLE